MTPPRMTRHAACIIAGAPGVGLPACVAAATDGHGLMQSRADARRPVRFDALRGGRRNFSLGNRNITTGRLIDGLFHGLDLNGFGKASR
jgi:hypothetical protein